MTNKNQTAGSLVTGGLSSGTNSIVSTTGVGSGISTYPSYYGGISSGYITWPHQDHNPNQVVIRTVENGFVLTMNGKEYIISDKKQVIKYLELAEKNIKEIK